MEYCKEQRTLLRALEDLAARERDMHEIDKDHVMKVALTNLGMWTRDHWFPAAYAHATWHRLEPFFRLPGHVVYGADTVHVELRPFNNHQLNGDIAAVCASVLESRPHLPDGRRLVFTVADAGRPVLDVLRWSVA